MLLRHQSIRRLGTLSKSGVKIYMMLIGQFSYLQEVVLQSERDGRDNYLGVTAVNQSEERTNL